MGYSSDVVLLQNLCSGNFWPFLIGTSLVAPGSVIISYLKANDSDIWFVILVVGNEDINGGIDEADIDARLRLDQLRREGHGRDDVKAQQLRSQRQETAENRQNS